ncbi:MAG: S-layer homology domain-containing protein [Clostridiales bacterium]|nr:S-layer homology domain-containing protein [Clostridiales bacterium]
MQKKKLLITFLVFILISITVAFALSSPGSQSDPLVPLSYINNKYIPSILDETQTRAQSKFNSIYENVIQNFESKQDRWLILKENAALYQAVLKKLGTTGTTKFTETSVKKGDVITGKPGTRMIIRSGTAAIVGPSNGVLINVTVGAERKPGSATSKNIYYMVASDDGTGLKVTSDSAVIALSGNYTITSAYKVQYQKVAEALSGLNLFKGTSDGFQLDRSATRIESLVMLIRLLGEENKALSFTGVNPFTDVPSWASKYSAYAYSKGYTTGTSKNQFSPNSATTKEQYMTFLLRALSYSDSAGDFNWQQSFDFSVKAGLLTSSEKTLLQNSNFYRDQVVFVSYKALFAKLKNSNTTLSEKLIANNVFTQAMLEAARLKSGVE